MSRRIHAAPASALAFGLLLAGCGGGGSGGAVGSTPVGPYARMVDVVQGTYSFQSAGVTYTAASSGFSNGSTDAFGGGGTIAYNAPSDTFTITAPGGTSQSFTAADLVSSGSAAVNFQKTVGSTQDSLTVTVPLTYAMLTVWNRQDLNTGISTGRIQIGGSPTQASDVPRSGSASYTVQSGGAASVGGTTYNLVNSSATFSANFASNSVQTSLTLGGVSSPGGAVSTFGTFSGTGAISASGPGFTGTLTGSSANGAFAGAFFGPQAAEAAYGYVLTGSAFSAAGAVFGTKQ